MKLTEEEFEKLLSNMELDAPSMSFTRNVMDQVAQEMQPVALKTRVDKRIIYGIAAVFVTALLAVFVYAGTQRQLMILSSGAQFDLKFSLALDRSVQSILLNVFLFTDLIIALFYFDRFLRRKLRAT